MSDAALGRLRKSQCVSDRFARCRELFDLLFDGGQNLSSCGTHVFTGRSAGAPNSEKGSDLFQGKSESKGVLDQPNLLSCGFTVFSIASAGSRGARKDTNSFVVTNRIGADAGKLRDLAYFQWLVLRSGNLGSRIKKTLDPGTVLGFTLEVCHNKEIHGKTPSQSQCLFSRQGLFSRLLPMLSKTRCRQGCPTKNT
jgi:hypothetical protein